MNKKSIILLIILLATSVCINIKLINKVTNYNNIQLQDTTYNRIELDSIEFNIIKRDSIIYNIKLKIKEDEKTIENLNDSSTMQLFIELVQ